MIKPHFSIFFITMLAVSACASRPSRLEVSETSSARGKAVYQYDEVALYRLDQWLIQGRIVIKFGDQAEVGDLRWRQVGDSYDIVISGPAGLGGIRIQGGHGHVSLNDNGRHVEGTSPELLIQDTYGWTLPVSNLLYWMKALPAPFEEFAWDEREGRRVLHQSGWEVSYRRFVPYGGEQGAVCSTSTLCLPSLLDLRYADQLHLKVSIYRWES